MCEMLFVPNLDELYNTIIHHLIVDAFVGGFYYYLIFNTFLLTLKINMYIMLYKISVNATSGIVVWILWIIRRERQSTTLYSLVLVFILNY